VGSSRSFILVPVVLHQFGNLIDLLLSYVHAKSINYKPSSPAVTLPLPTRERASFSFSFIWILQGFYCGFFFVIVPEVGAFVNAFLLQFPGDTHYTEHIYRAWYVWECLEMGSCGKAYTAYIRIYLLPQMILTLAAIILHVRQFIPT